MTSHETALEAAAQALADDHDKRTSRKLHRDLFRDTATTAISAYISTLSPDVSGLVERLRNGPVGYISEVGSFHTPPDALHIEAADALASLSLQLAAVEGERDAYAVYSRDNSMRAFQWMAAHDALKAGVPYEYPSPADLPDAITRAETAEASLFAAQEENERLRKAVLPAYMGLLVLKTMCRKAGLVIGVEATEDAMESLVTEMPELPSLSALRSSATLSTPSKEDKTDAE